MFAQKLSNICSGLKENARALSLDDLDSANESPGSVSAVMEPLWWMQINTKTRTKKCDNGSLLMSVLWITAIPLFPVAQFLLRLHGERVVAKVCGD